MTETRRSHYMHFFSWWRHQMETFFALLAPLYGEIHRSAVNSPHKGQLRRVLMFSLICTWLHGWVNIREAGDLRRHRAHYDVNVMWRVHCTIHCDTIRRTNIYRYNPPPPPPPKHHHHQHHHHQHHYHRHRHIHIQTYRHTPPATSPHTPPFRWTRSIHCLYNHIFPLYTYIYTTSFISNYWYSIVFMCHYPITYLLFEFLFVNTAGKGRPEFKYTF